MALHSGIDTVAFVSFGVYTETYGSTDTANIPSLFSSWGMLENAPNPLPGLGRVMKGLFRMGMSIRLA